MAAITSVLRTVTEPGHKLVVPADGYYQVRAYANEFLAPRGVTVIEARCAEMCDAAQDADVVLAETPSNPGLDVVDLHHLAMHCRARGAMVIVDNTTATPLGQQPLSLGADLVVASATKALAGHHDVLAGYVAGSQPEVMERLQRERLLAGPILGGFEAWLVLRGLGTLGLRFERQCQNAAAVALMLRSHPAVRSVRYPGLPSDPSHDIASAQMRRFGGIVAVELTDADAVHELVRRSALLVSSTSFGGIHSSVDRRARWGDPVGAGFARLSMGIEDTDDLVSDLAGALAAA
jgi:cystathionine gamma-lyase